MSGRYAEFVETEVLLLFEKKCNVKLTKDPDGRATMGCSSGGFCELIMAWHRPDLCRRVLTDSGTYANQQWPCNARFLSASGSFMSILFVRPMATTDKPMVAEDTPAGVPTMVVFSESDQTGVAASKSAVRAISRNEPNARCPPQEFLAFIKDS